MEYFGYGLIAGATATIISHPFDTCKTFIQGNERIDKNIYKKIYRGITPAIIGYSIEKTFVFGIYSNIINDKTNYINTFNSGFITGGIISVTTTPAEQIKIDKQFIIKTEYKLTNLYKGIIPTFFREAIGFGIYFTTYEYLSNKYNKEKKIIKTGMIGACACFNAWMIIYPIDKIKTQIQSNKKIEILSIRQMYKGIHFGLLRAIPFHSTCFIVFERLIRKD